MALGLAIVAVDQARDYVAREVRTSIEKATEKILATIKKSHGVTSEVELAGLRDQIVG